MDKELIDILNIPLERIRSENKSLYETEAGETAVVFRYAYHLANIKEKLNIYFSQQISNNKRTIIDQTDYFVDVEYNKSTSENQDGEMANQVKNVSISLSSILDDLVIKSKHMPWLKSDHSAQYRDKIEEAISKDDSLQVRPDIIYHQRGIPYPDRDGENPPNPNLLVIEFKFCNTIKGGTNIDHHVSLLKDIIKLYGFKKFPYGYIKTCFIRLCRENIPGCEGVFDLDLDLAPNTVPSSDDIFDLLELLIPSEHYQDQLEEKS